jgi:hypothetical protein
LALYFKNALLPILLFINSGLFLWSSASPGSEEVRPRRRVSASENNTPLGGDYSNRSGSANKELATSLTAGNFTSYSDSSQLEATASLGVLINPSVQLGGEGGLKLTNNSGGSSQSALQLFVFGSYNFDALIEDSFYMKGGFGVINSSTNNGSGSNSSRSKTGFFLGFGKRFLLWPHLSYTPEFRISQFEKESSYFTFKFLNFSIFF